MPSIRLFLTLTIIAIITLVSFLSSLRGYRQSMGEAGTLFNEQLLEYALMISTTLPALAGSGSMLGNTASSFNPELDNAPDFQNTLVFQVLDESGTLIFNFNTNATTALTSLNSGYNDVNFDGYRWHTYVYRDLKNRRWIVTAQRYDIRYALAERVVLESVLPIVVGIPIAGLLVWLMIGVGLNPISNLANQLKLKEASDLSSIELDRTPRELKSLKDSANDLLARLKSSFEREKRFAADAAHELRTPISILKVQIHNLLEELQEPSVSVQQLNVGIDRMGHLVEQILDLNRTSPDLYMTNFEQLDLHELCQEVASECYEQIMVKNQELELIGNKALINGDRFAIDILLKNLLSNASKYTQEEGRIIVRVSHEKAGITLQVVDNGPGIAPHDRERVLERFYRATGDQQPHEQPGCGLGLAIVQHIVTLHNARMKLEEPASGTGLSVTIAFENRGFGHAT